jgi:hypothetical protein
MGSHQSRYGGGGEEERIPLPLAGVEPCRPPSKLVPILTELFLLPHISNTFVNIIQTYKQVLRIGQR